MKKKWIAAIIIYIALIAVCLIVVYAVPSVKGMLEKTYVTEYGKIDIADEVSAYIVRDETVYVAAQESEVKRVAEEGELYKAGTVAVELTPIIDEQAEALKETGADAVQKTAEAAAEANEEAPDDIGRRYTRVIESLDGNVVYTSKGKTRDAGYISYSIDGAEAMFSTDNLDNLRMDDYESIAGLRSVDAQSRKCSKGEPLFKVISNRKWYLVFYIDNEAGEKYYEGRTVSVDIGGETVPVRVSQVQTGKKTTKVTLSCKTFFEDFFTERRLKTTVTVASAEGLVLQDSSIVLKGDQPGVFVKNKLGEHRFKPVSVKADDGTRCVVYSDIYVDADGNFVETVNTYDEIVAEPTEEEIAQLQVQAAKEAEEKAKEEERRAKEEADRLEAEKAAAEKAAAEKAAAEKAEAEKKAAAKKSDSKKKDTDKSDSDKSNKEDNNTEGTADQEQATEGTPPAEPAE